MKSKITKEQIENAIAKGIITVSESDNGFTFRLGKGMINASSDTSECIYDILKNDESAYELGIDEIEYEYYMNIIICSEEAEQETASRVEDIMYIRGEYEFDNDDRIRWLKDISNYNELSKNSIAFINARTYVTKNISEDIQNGKVESIISYLNDQLYEMCEDDELIPEVENIISELKK